MPVYKSEKVLRKCVDSLLAQKFSNLELILVDDGSPDSSGNICDEYKEIDARVKVIHKENRGVSSARNNGLAIASGDFIMFVDSDDFIDLKMIDFMVKNCIIENVDLIISGADYITTQNGYEVVCNKMNFRREILRSKLDLYNRFYPFIDVPGFNNVWGKLYSASVIEENNIRFDESLRIGEDAVFNLEYFRHINSCMLLPFNYYKYRLELNVSSKGYDPNIFRRRLYILDMFRSFCNKSELGLDGLWWHYIKTFYASIMALFHTNCPERFLSKVSIIRLLCKEPIWEEVLTNYRPRNILVTFMVFLIRAKCVFCIFCFAFLLKLVHSKLRKL